MVVYCVLWIPWRLDFGSARGEHTSVRVGYGWLWAGPRRVDIFDEVSDGRYDPNTRPDFPLIAMRIVAATGIAGSAFLVTKLLHL